MKYTGHYLYLSEIVFLRGVRLIQQSIKCYMRYRAYMSKYLFLVVGSILLSFPANAADKIVKKNAYVLDNCPLDDVLARTACIQDKLSKLEIDLDYLVKEGAKSIDNLIGENKVDEERKHVIKAQEAWKNYRDEFCQNDLYLNAIKEASERQLKISICLYDKTLQRIKEMHNRYFYQTE